MRGADDGQAIGALEHAERLADRLDQIAFEMRGDQLGDHFGIGFAAEVEALRSAAGA